MNKFFAILGTVAFTALTGCGGSSGDGASSGSSADGSSSEGSGQTVAAANGNERPWMNRALAAPARTQALLAAMTLDQKIQQLYNLPVLNEDLQDENPPCEFQRVGRHIEGIPELGIPTFRFANGGTGIRGGDCLPEPTATGLPSAVAAAATFNPEVNFRWGQVLSDEIRAWAHHSLWGPAFNMIRTPFGGRNHEYMSEDPYLAGTIATQQVRGIQSSGKTHATVKHFVGNESEYQQERWTAASRIPSRAMHEIYLLPFEMTVKDGKAASVMCAFPDLNFEWACENAPLLKQTLRERWGFDGYIVSDRRAMHSTVKSILAGTGFELDFEPEFYRPELIKAAIVAGEITETDIDRLLAPRYQKMFEFGHFDEPYDTFLQPDLLGNAQVARRAADEAVVLLKNDGLLPLNPNITSVALIGASWFAGQATLPPRSSNRDELVTVNAPYTVSPQQGLENTLRRLGSPATVRYNDGDVIDDAVKVAQSADVVILMVGDRPRETQDVETPSLPSVTGTNQDLLVPRILEANPNTVVVLKTQGSVLMPWEPQARALVQAWYPGQEDGNVVADILFGVNNPSGKLPVTFGNTEREAAYETEAQYPGTRENNGKGGKSWDPEPGQPQLVANYLENLLVGYRWYQARNVEPRFPFGHGLSYTTFSYSDLNLTPSTAANGQTVLDVEYTVTNTGTRAGQEASQVYLTLPAEAEEPFKRLVGFRKVDLQPGDSERVSVQLDCSASNHPFSYFRPTDDTDLRQWANGDWVTPSGEFTVHVGTSSAQTPLQSPVSLALQGCAS
ncbi:MAG TPA: glycoside hydrolase family 3 C-terminal domain-containing protein [Noviherbaspirillum sp.]